MKLSLKHPISGAARCCRARRHVVVLFATAAPSMNRQGVTPQWQSSQRVDTLAFLDNSDQNEQQGCCQGDHLIPQDPVLCEGLKRSRTSLPPEVERLAGGFTDAPEACGPLTGIAKWWSFLFNPPIPQQDQALSNITHSIANNRVQPASRAVAKQTQAKAGKGPAKGPAKSVAAARLPALQLTRVPAAISKPPGHARQQAHHAVAAAQQLRSPQRPLQGAAARASSKQPLPRSRLSKSTTAFDPEPQPAAVESTAPGLAPAQKRAPVSTAPNHSPPAGPFAAQGSPLVAAQPGFRLHSPFQQHKGLPASPASVIPDTPQEQAHNAGAHCSALDDLIARFPSSVSLRPATPQSPENPNPDPSSPTSSTSPSTPTTLFTKNQFTPSPPAYFPSYIPNTVVPNTYLPNTAAQQQQHKQYSREVHRGQHGGFEQSPCLLNGPPSYERLPEPTQVDMDVDELPTYAPRSQPHTQTTPQTTPCFSEKEHSASREGTPELWLTPAEDSLQQRKSNSRQTASVLGAQQGSGELAEVCSARLPDASVDSSAEGGPQGPGGPSAGPLSVGRGQLGKVQCENQQGTQKQLDVQHEQANEEQIQYTPVQAVHSSQQEQTQVQVVQSSQQTPLQQVAARPHQEVARVRPPAEQPICSTPVPRGVRENVETVQNTAAHGTAVEPVQNAAANSATVEQNAATNSAVVEGPSSPGAPAGPQPGPPTQGPTGPMQDVLAAKQHFVEGCPEGLMRLYETFPFQREAIEYVDACNVARDAVPRQSKRKSRLQQGGQQSAGVSMQGDLHGAVNRDIAEEYEAVVQGGWQVDAGAGAAAGTSYALGGFGESQWDFEQTDGRTDRWQEGPLADLPSLQDVALSRAPFLTLMMRQLHEADQHQKEGVLQQQQGVMQSRGEQTLHADAAIAQQPHTGAAQQEHRVPYQLGGVPMQTPQQRQTGEFVSASELFMQQQQALYGPGLGECTPATAYERLLAGTPEGGWPPAAAPHIPSHLVPPAGRHAGPFGGPPRGPLIPQQWPYGQALPRPMPHSTAADLQSDIAGKRKRTGSIEDACQGSPIVSPVKAAPRLLGQDSVGLQQGAPAGPPGAVALSQDAGAQQPPPRVVPWSDEYAKLFCEERTGNSGYGTTRHFVATSLPALWRQYRRRDRMWHLYEILREGRPCHIHFDLEFNVAANANTDGDVLVDHLLAIVQQHVRSQHNLDFGCEHVLELDSSTPEKFSRHLIVRLPDAAFATNIELGHFVQHLLNTSEAQQLLVNRGPGAVRGPSIMSFVDKGIYTKNRQFRVLWSSKHGKTARLVPTARFMNQGWKLSDEELFFTSLVTLVPPDAKLIRHQRMLPPAWAVAQSAAPTGPVTSPGGGPLGPAGPQGPHAEGPDSVAPPSGDDGVAVPHEPFRVHAYVRGRMVDIKVSWRHATASSQEHQAYLDELARLAARAVPFIEQKARERAGGLDAWVRTMAICGLEGSVAYSMLGPGSHVCENIGRAHRSNHIFMTANFAMGTYAQKCHDPVCHQFRSQWMPLPGELKLPATAAEFAQAVTDARRTATANKGGALPFLQ